MLRGELHRRTSLDLKQFIDKVRTIIHSRSPLYIHGLFFFAQGLLFSPSASYLQNLRGSTFVRQSKGVT